MATETVNVTGTIADDAVTNAKLANMATATIKGRVTAGTGDPEDLTANQASTVLDAATDPFVRTSNLPAGGGDVVGPASATADSLARFDGITGKLLKDGLATSTGGNGSTDAGKVPLFGADGSLTASTGLGGGSAVVAETGALSTAAVDGFSTNGGEGGKFQSVGGDGVSGTSNTGAALRGTSDTGPGLHVNITDAGNTANLALFHRDDNLGMEVRNDGGLAWTSATGAASTRTNLGLGTLATQSGTFSGTSSGTNTGDQTAVTGNAGTATALQTARTINGVSFDGSANIIIAKPNTPFMVRAAVAFAYTNLPAAADFFQGLASASVFPADLTNATQARIYAYTATTGSAGSKLSIKYKTGAWSATPGDYADIGTSEVACTIDAGNTFTESGWVDLAAAAKDAVFVSVFGLGGNGTADPTFNIVGVQFR